MGECGQREEHAIHMVNIASQLSNKEHNVSSDELRTLGCCQLLPKAVWVPQRGLSMTKYPLLARLTSILLGQSFHQQLEIRAE